LDTLAREWNALTEVMEQLLGLEPGFSADNPEPANERQGEQG